MGVTHTYLLLGRLLGGNPEDTSLKDPKVPEGITVPHQECPLEAPSCNDVGMLWYLLSDP